MGAQADNKTILLVEDEKIIRDMVRDILLSGGHDVTTAENGIEALNICRKSEKLFDLLITDYNMPQMNGRKLAEEIKSLRGAKNILFMSGYPNDEDFLRKIFAGEKNFIAKPFSPAILIAKVTNILAES